MKCSACGTENPADALYCKHCGRRLEAVCAVCGAPLAPDANFCNMCGSPVSARAPLPAQPSAPPPPFSFCPPAARPARTRQGGTAQTVLGYVGGGLAMLGALLSFLFVFFIGTAASGDLSSSAEGMMLNAQGSSLYYYFGGVYRDIRDLLLSLDGASSYCRASLYLMAVFGTVAAAATLAAAVSLFPVTIVRYVRNLTGRTEKRPEGLAFASFFVFLLGALLLLSVERVHIGVQSSDAAASVGVVLSGATIGGICAGGVCMAGALGCALARGGRDYGVREAVLRYVFCGVSLVLAVTVCALLAGGCVQLVPAAATDVSGVITLGFSAALFMAGIQSTSFSTSDEAMFEFLAGHYNAAMCFAVIGLVLTAALAVLAVFLLGGICARITEGRKKTLAFSLAFALTAIVAAVMAALLANSLSFILDGGASQRSTAAGLTAVILTAVFAAVLLILAVVHAVIGRGMTAQGGSPQPVPVPAQAGQTAPAFVPQAEQPAPADEAPAPDPERRP